MGLEKVSKVFTLLLIYKSSNSRTRFTHGASFRAVSCTASFATRLHNPRHLPPFHPSPWKNARKAPRVPGASSRNGQCPNSFSRNVTLAIALPFPSLSPSSSPSSSLNPRSRYRRRSSTARWAPDTGSRLPHSKCTRPLPPSPPRTKQSKPSSHRVWCLCRSTRYRISKW